ncbi:DUF2786 domain-containing protein [Cryptosporangium arvum]|uniref:Uncharacterized protein n=1 Tax=Cryptosporangium arvum DSM 44712 TaxID=927661 RepID=A0A010ZTB8_9ACTN|nr:DUF2786 domain-containing protein [Cryptosporangium arvum]EXG80467.1 Protein of unknown function (DUF2786) [Cryptosporangium arvum DSM 44712]
MSSTDAKLAVIRKLLAQAEDAAASPAEAETFTAKAAELMARYGVDRAMLADGDETADGIADREIPVDPPYARDKFGLLAGIARAMGLRVVHKSGYRGRDTTALLFGFASDIERAEILFTSLLLQAVRGVLAARVPPGEHVAAYRRSWIVGFSATIHHRLAEAEERARAQTTSTSAAGRSAEVVLADRRRVVDTRFAEAFPRLGTMGPRYLSGSGHREGAAAGHRADLGVTSLRSRQGVIDR